MASIIENLEKVKKRMSESDFQQNKGLSNEVGIHVMCYEPKDEMIVQAFFKQLKNRTDLDFRIIECDLYSIFLEICEDKRIMKGIPNQEARRGKDFLLRQLQNVASPEAFVEKMKYEPHQEGDVVLISGVGKVYPFMRSHKILDNIQHVFEDVPVVMLYPGTFDGQDLGLFGKFLDGHYYRAFNLL